MTAFDALSLKAVRALNAELELLYPPQRVCRVCQGRPLPLDAAHFYRRNRGKWETRCKACCRAASQTLQHARYHADPEYRARKLAIARLWRRRHPDKTRAIYRATYARRKGRRKAVVFARILGATP